MQLQKRKFVFCRVLLETTSCCIQTNVSSQRLIIGITSIVRCDLAVLTSPGHQEGVPDPKIEVSEPKRERRKKGCMRAARI